MDYWSINDRFKGYSYVECKGEDTVLIFVRILKDWSMVNLEQRLLFSTIHTKKTERHFRVRKLYRQTIMF